jgi:hypothetical protein
MLAPLWTDDGQARSFGSSVGFVPTNAHAVTLLPSCPPTEAIFIPIWLRCRGGDWWL